MFWAFILLILPLHAEVTDRIAAVVNDEVITLSDIYDLGGDFIEEQAGARPELRRGLELEVLDALILRSLIAQEIERLGLSVTEVELDRTIDDIAGRNGLDRDSLKQEVERGGLPWDNYLEELRENIRQMKFSQAVIRPRIAVNEDELKDAYLRMTSSMDLPQQAQLGAIFLALDPAGGEEAQAVLLERSLVARQRVVDGEDFATVSAELDEGPYGSQGGTMGLYSQGELVTSLDGPAFSTPIGEISEPIVTAQGIFLLYIFDRHASDIAPFEEVRDQLLNQVYADRIDLETDLWYEQARRKAALSIKLSAAED
jgi:peptidyl-prolyl cis-trans isomerase SurA